MNQEMKYEKIEGSISLGTGGASRVGNQSWIVIRVFLMSTKKCEGRLGVWG